MKQTILFLLLMLMPMIANADDSGECGDGVTYEYLENSQTLVISKTGEGTGAMKNCDGGAPWNSYRDNICEVRIEDGVTTIGRWAFNRFSKLSKVTIPNSVTSILDYAFYDCSSLNSIDFPSGITKIEGSALDGCPWFDNQPDGLVYIGKIAYRYKGDMPQNTIIEIKDGTTEVYRVAFVNCKGLTNISFPESLRTIGEEAFCYCDGLTSVNFPGNITTIGRSAFYGCTKLKDVTSSNSIISVEAGAFYNTQWFNNQPDGLVYIDKVAYQYKGDAFNKKIEIREGTVNISPYAFKDCGLASVVLPMSMTAIGNYAFYGCTGLASITIPISVTSIGTYAFYGCSGMDAIEIPNSVTSIDSYAYMGCSALTSVTLPSSLSFLGAGVFQDCSNLSLVTILSPSLKRPNYEYNDFPFGNNASGRIIYVPADSYDFYKSMWSKQSYNIFYLGENNGSCGESVKYSFDPSTGMLLISGEGAMMKFDTYNQRPWMSFRSSIKCVDIETGVTTISDNAFQDCTNLSSVTIPISVDYIGVDAFSGTKWYEDQSDGLIYAGKVAYKYKGENTEDIDIVIKEGTLSISPYAFSGCSSLKSVVFPNSIVSIGSRSFYQCYGLTSVSIPSKVKTIEQYTFQECNNLESLTLPEELLSIGNSAFWGCNLLVSINIPKSVTSIGQYAFWGCSSLPKIDIPAIENIEKYTFAECHSLISISIPEVVKMIGQNAFQGCKSLASISIPNSVTSIGAKCFAGCSSLKKISLPYGITNISSGLFKDCSSLQDIDLPSTIDYIENEAFSGCSSLETFNIPQKVSGIYESTFRGCSNLKSVTIPENVTNIGQTAFYECSSLESIDIPANVSFIGRSVFGGCFSLGSIFIDKNNIVYDSRDNCNAIIETGTNTLLYGCNNTTIPNGIVAIENWAFNKSTGLSILNIPESVTSIQDYSFVECTGLKSITVDKANPKYDSRDNCNAIIETATNRLILACSELVIPKGITSFSNESLKNCVTLSLPEDMVTITSGMFYGCDKLESLKIPGSVTKIEESSLNNCSNLKNLSFEEGKETLTFEVSYPAYYSKPQWFSNCPLDSIFIARNLKYDFTPKGYGTYHLSPFREKKTIRKVVFGDNVSIIPNGIFSECTNLKAVKMPSKPETLGGSAFYKCDSLTYISIPEGIKEIGSSTFYGCGKIPSFVIPQGVETIGESAFFSCDSISSIIIPNSVTYIARNAFGGCKNLSELKIEDGSEDLAIREESYMLAFGQCPLESIYLGRNIRNDSYNYIFSSLASIQTPFDLKISSYVTKLSGGTFANCRQIKTLSFEEGKDTLTLIKDHNAYSSIMPFDKTPIDSIYMGRVVIGYDNYYPDTKVIPFSNTDSVYTMTIGANFTEIGDGLFYRWQVDKLIIPENVLSIGVDAFSECASLYSVKIEDGDKALEFKDGTGFAKCQLKELYLGRKLIYDTWKSPFRYNKEALSSVIIGNQVTEISMCEFVGLKSLKEIVLPQSLTKIDYQAFYGCESLADVTSYAKEVPVTGETVFTESYLPKATLHILESSRDAYKSNYPWSKFGCFALIKENGEEEYITIGDANGDRKVDAEDIVAITNFIMGNPSDGFNFDGADTNGDGIIDIADIVNISNISVGVK